MCALFLHGLCTKGDKCKYSHDKATTGKQRQKRDIHQDDRDDHADCTLEEAVAAIQNRDARSTKNKSERVCRFFLEAIEQEKIGYFWECPNIVRFGHCKYRHALPAGFILKRDAVAQRVSANTRDLDNHQLEDEIEAKRAQITNGTPVTPETFAAWKAARLVKKQEEAAKATKDKNEEQRRAGIVRQFLGVTGSKMFELDPSMFEEPEEKEEADQVETPASLDSGIAA
ncbi:hypothetical protein KIPB_010652 [Kipferlia bialata]|uniref:C3H1-type domain-containing protein n=1 Tax=Kipferlia bialata TaxID=797122 RepID=A0A9K3GLQ4_9EUKA|nr:hypothetical protein KIPB_010652 [Kipferlia bialata]|eukprot:g10652.t1